MANFTWTPHMVIGLAPLFPNIITQTDSFAKNYQQLDTTAIEQFQLTFKSISTATRNSILSHYNTTGYGSYASFTWTTVPSHVKSGANQTVRYIPGGYKEFIADLTGLWDIEIIFEIDT